MKYILCFIFILFQISAIKGQTNVRSVDSLKKIEQFLISTQLDSVKHYLEFQKPSHYVRLLSDITNDKDLDYTEYQTFLDSLSRRLDINYLEVSDFINRRVAVPSSSDIVAIKYTKIKYNQISELRNLGNLNEASAENQKLESYLSTFDQEQREVKIQNAYAQIHTSVMYYIERDLEKGKLILENNLALARSLGHIELEIASLYYLADYLVLDGNLESFIKMGEQTLALEKKLKKRSPYYLATIQHLLNGYIFKEGEDERVLTLLDELYDSPTERPDSYSLYAQFLSTLDESSLSRKQIYDTFKVSNSKEFVDKIVADGEAKITPNGFYYLLMEGSKVLERDGYFTEALRLQERSNVLTREIYSEDLAKSLANYQTKIAVKDKETEVMLVEERSKLYAIFGLVAILLLLGAVYLWLKTKKQALVLTKQKKVIERALEEKEMLVKEVHHRVKNNFQIVSSLLELQSKDIEDEKAQQMANDGQNRIKSMALIHQKLYQNKSGLVDFDQYIRLLVKELTAAYVSDKKVETSVTSQGMMFDVDTAIPLGLIINELITNAYKYAFQEKKQHKLDIKIESQKQGIYSLEITDNGIGLEDNFSIKNAKSLGLRLVKRLVKQLHGNLVAENDNGAKFFIIFKDLETRKAIQ